MRLRTRSRVTGAQRPRGSIVNIYVDSLAGSDSSNGSLSEPVQSISQAIALTSANQTIGLRRGQRHPISGVVNARNITSYGSELSPPCIDARQNLSGKTWTLHSGNVWTTTVTFRETTVAGGIGSNSNTTYFGLWDCRTIAARGALLGDWLAWRVGGADIAANIAAVEANPGSWTIHRTGSTQQDPRSTGESSTSFTVYLRLSDSSDPNGQLIQIADQNGIASFGSDQVIDDVDLIGSWGKDNLGFSGANPPTLTRVRHLDFGCHAGVGPCNLSSVTFSGQSRPGMTNAADNRGLGGSPTFYVETATGRTLTINQYNCSNNNSGLYFHGTASDYHGYKRVNIVGPMTANNMLRVLQVDSRPTIAFIEEGIHFTGLLTAQCRQFANIGGVLVLDCDNGSTIELVDSIAGGVFETSRSFSHFTIKNVTLNNTYTQSGFGQRRELTSGASGSTLILDGVIDTNADLNNPSRVYGRRLVQNRTVPSSNSIVLQNGTVLGDMTINGSSETANYPASLTVGAGCQFGWGNRTGPQIEAWLTGLGVTHSISGQTTIVGTGGTVLSSPGWK